MTTRIGLGTILGQLRHLPIEIIARIKEEANLTVRLEKLNRWVNNMASDVDDWITDDSYRAHPDDALGWVREFAKGVLNVRRQEDSIRATACNCSQLLITI